MKARSIPLRTTGADTQASAGFTLLDALAVLAVLAIIAAWLTPVLARTQLDSKAAQCMNNARQIATALLLYSADHQEFLPPNPDDGNQVTGHNWCPGLAGTGDPHEFNPDLLNNPSAALVAPYLRNDPKPFACPADTRVGLYTGTEPDQMGKRVRAARSISMNGAVGSICGPFDAGGGHGGAPRLATNGPWLNNSHSHRRDQPWKTFGKTTSFTATTPAQIWLTMEEDPASLNDGNFAFGMNTAEWIDWPGTTHNMAATINFGDGHVELHRWLDNRTRVPASGAVMRLPVPGSVDWQWLSARTSFRVP